MYLSKHVLTLGTAFVFASSAMAQVTIVQNFTGTTLNDTLTLGTGAIPPDSNAIVGPSHVVEFINGAFTVYSKTGNGVVGSVAATPVAPRITDGAFWNGITHDATYNAATISAGISDPKAIFDKNTNTYFAVEINVSSTNNVVLVARTAPGSNPAVLSNWKGTSYVGRASNFVDYPMLGVDANAVYISTNDFASSSGGFVGTTLGVIPKTNLTAATPVTTNKTLLTNVTNIGSTPQPVIDWSVTKGNGVFVGVGGATTMRIADIAGTTGSGATVVGGSATSVTVNTYSTALSDGFQPDGTAQLDTSDGRQTKAAWQVGSDLWTVHSVVNAGLNGNRATLNWYRFNAATNTLISQGAIGNSSGNFDYFNPSIAANSLGDVVISFTRSGNASTGAAGDAGSYAVAGTTLGAVTTFGSDIALQPGLVNNYHVIGGAGERWGDYSAVSLDPSDDLSFWVANEYALSSNRWAVNIAQLQFAAVPEPLTMSLMGIVGVVTGLGWYRHRRRLAKLNEMRVKT